MPFGTPTTEAELAAYLHRTGLRPIPGSEPRLNHPAFKAPGMPQDETSGKNVKRYELGAERGTFGVLSPKNAMPDTQAVLPLEVTLAMELQTEGNTRRHWRTASAKAKVQRLGVYNALCCYGSARLLTAPLTITIVRIAPRPLGPTNIMSACKHIIDGTTDWLTSKPGKGHYYDDDPRFTWHPQQEKGERGYYAVHIRIEETL